MSPLSKELIAKLANENDVEVLKEVFHFYAFLKQRKEDEIKKQWSKVEEVEADEDELKIIKDFTNNPTKYEFVSMEEVLKELEINESEL
jgi:ATP:corrinoid adenosyltransferase